MLIDISINDFDRTRYYILFGKNYTQQMGSNYTNYKRKTRKQVSKGF